MLKDITIGQFIPGNSYVHRLDPRTKITVTFVWMVALFLVTHFIGYLLFTALIAAAVLLSGISPRYLFKGLKPLIFIIILTVGLNMFMTPGTPIWHWGFLTLTREGVRQGLFMAFRLILLVVIASLLTLTTSPIALTDGIERLLNPFRKIGVPAHELAMMMTIALRFIPTLLEETEKIMKAQMARGADFESGNLWQRAKSLVPLLVPLFISAFRRADDLALAMEARCYRGGENRTRMKVLKFTAEDHVTWLITAVLVAAVIWLRWI